MVIITQQQSWLAFNNTVDMVEISYMASGIGVWIDGAWPVILLASTRQSDRNPDVADWRIINVDVLFVENEQCFCRNLD